MQQQKRCAFALARDLYLDALQCVIFYFIRHDDPSAALLFNLINYLSFRTTARPQRRAVALMQRRWKRH